MTFFANLGAGLSDVAGTLHEKLEGIVNSIINFLRDIASYVYIWFQRFWNFVMENPRGAVLFFANMWVMMT